MTDGSGLSANEEAWNFALSDGFKDLLLPTIISFDRLKWLSNIACIGGRGVVLGEWGYNSLIFEHDYLCIIWLSLKRNDSPSPCRLAQGSTIGFFFFFFAQPGRESRTHNLSSWHFQFERNKGQKRRFLLRHHYNLKTGLTAKGL